MGAKKVERPVEPCFLNAAPRLYTTARATQHTPHEGEHAYTKYAHQASASPSQHFAANVPSRQSGAPESASKPRILRIVSLPNRDHEARVARSAALEPRVMCSSYSICNSA